MISNVRMPKINPAVKDKIILNNLLSSWVKYPKKNAIIKPTINITHSIYWIFRPNIPHAMLKDIICPEIALITIFVAFLFFAKMIKYNPIIKKTIPVKTQKSFVNLWTYK